MKGILFVGHGELPVAMKHSAQMIIGPASNLYAVSLEPDDGKEELATKLDEVIQQMKEYDTILVFADLLGGSPANAALEKFFNSDEVTIISGMNLPMVLTAALADLPAQEIISEGRAGIKDLKNQVEEQKKPVQKKEQVQKKAGRPVEIKNVRIDARGIHGQVATAWVPHFGVNRIIVIDDRAVKDDVQKMALKVAKPNQAKLSILSTKKAVERLQDVHAYQDESAMIILQRVETLSALDKLGYHFKEVNMGNIPNRPDTKAYRKTVNLTNEEVEIIRQQISHGTHFTAQQVPNDTQVDFDKVIQE